jgi:hypothetical protein
LSPFSVPATKFIAASLIVGIPSSSSRCKLVFREINRMIDIFVTFAHPLMEKAVKQVVVLRRTPVLVSASVPEQTKLVKLKQFCNIFISPLDVTFGQYDKSTCRMCNASAILKHNSSLTTARPLKTIV